MTKKVLVPVADGTEELEALTIVDVLRRAGVEVTIAPLPAIPDLVMIFPNPLREINGS